MLCLSKNVPFLLFLTLSHHYCSRYNTVVIFWTFLIHDSVLLILCLSPHHGIENKYLINVTEYLREKIKSLQKLEVLQVCRVIPGWNLWLPPRELKGGVCSWGFRGSILLLNVYLVPCTRLSTLSKDPVSEKGGLSYHQSSQARKRRAKRGHEKKCQSTWGLVSKRGN